ncbi:MAG: site-specific integrase [Pseudolabrys sp.]|nr:site-specific integrase [Pseudolabrys sp.]
MPRRAKGARLYLRAARTDAAGNITHASTWVIRDGGRIIGTGCLEHEAGAAEQKLKAYLAEKYEPRRKVQDIESILIADVLSVYVDDCRDRQRNLRTFDKRIARLNAFWGRMCLAAVNGESCRAYQKHRDNKGGARRDLEDLRAAINHHAGQGLHHGVVSVLLPPKGRPRDRWLTRKEAAKLVWACWRYREIQRAHRGPMRGKLIETDKRPLRHLARFILIGLYTGTRASAIASASPVPAIGRSYVDLERGRFYRLQQGAAASNKRQPTVPLPPRLLAHMRRWHGRALIAAHFVEHNGKPVKSVKTAFKHAVTLAKLGAGVSPHTLRHTAATWMMQAGVDMWQAAGYLGMTAETLERVYGHHHPDHLKGAVEAAGRGGRAPVQAKVL